MSTLFVVATPIGNLEDISARALRILNEADLILAEDTRVSKNLLTHFGIKTPLISYHQHSKLNKINEIIAKLKQGCNLALISDAGTPSISDPGNFLVEQIIESLGSLVKIEPIPGASAVTAIASVCGFAMDRFLFLGFQNLNTQWFFMNRLIAFLNR
jgi:16S rRNA (cytidine1402-2'-O)-methyltransferase